MVLKSYFDYYQREANKTCLYKNFGLSHVSFSSWKTFSDYSGKRLKFELKMGISWARKIKIKRVNPK